MDACTIFTHFTDLSVLPLELGELIAPQALAKEGGDADWERLSFSRRKLLRKRNLELVPLRGGANFQDRIRRLVHVYSSIPTDSEDIRQQLLARLANMQSAIEFRVDGPSLVGFEDIIFACAKAVEGLIFWDGKQMLDAEGNLVLDFEGGSRVSELEAVEIENPKTAYAEDAMSRKSSNEAWMKDLKVHFNSNLPPIEGEAETETRSVEEVVDRALALAVVALEAEGLAGEIPAQLSAAYGVGELLSPAESAFLSDSDPEESSLTNFVWRFESLWTLLWALGFVSELNFPSGICDVQAAVGLLRKLGNREALVSRVRMRSKAEILDQADRIYRLHWTVVDARMRGEKEPPVGLHPSVIHERHWALNWLRQYEKKDWDKVSVDV